MRRAILLDDLPLEARGFSGGPAYPFAREYAATYLAGGPIIWRRTMTSTRSRPSSGQRGLHLLGQRRHAHPRAAVPARQRRVVRQRWPAWRTLGISGGIVPWEFDRLAYDKPQFYKPESDNSIAMGPRAVPGIWPDTVAEGDLVSWTVSTDPQRPQWAKGARQWARR